MSGHSRRDFLAATSLGLLGAAAGMGDGQAPSAPPETQQPSTPPAGEPPAFGAGPPVGPEVSPATFLEAEKLVQIELTSNEREIAASSWRSNLAALYERRTGPRKLAIESTIPPYSQWNPVLPGRPTGPASDRFVRSSAEPGPLPASDEEIAYAPVTKLSRWIEQRRLSSERLTQIYLRRIERFDSKLRSIITLTPGLALERARQADAEIAAGKYRGALHGIPWGGKDLLDTAGITTTYGAEPFRNRIPERDAAVVKRLDQAGAVLIAKLSLGALALNDIWFGGQTMNPWLLEEGASGSSAGPGAATAAAQGKLFERRRAFGKENELQGIVGPIRQGNLSGGHAQFLDRFECSTIHIGRRVFHHPLAEVADPQPVQRRFGVEVQFARDARQVARIRPGDGVKHDRRVLHGACHGTELV